MCEGEIYSTGDELRVMGIAEAPGWEEDKVGRPLIGQSGGEARHHLDLNGITRHGVYLTNICLCHPPDNRDPHAEEIDTCTERWLLDDIEALRPEYIITWGRIATRYFLGDVTMELIHGIPHTIDFHGQELIVIPSYHPAAGLHDPSQMILFQADMVTAGQVIKGTVMPRPVVDEFAGKEVYKLVEDDDLDDLYPILYTDGPVAIDTEWAKGPWCLSVSVVPGESFVVRADQGRALDAIGTVLAKGHTTTIIHNAAYDLPVLAQMGIFPAKPADTMVMAYLLQSEPQGLKALAYRHCGMEMSSYGEMVDPATRAKAIAYLEIVMEMEWPDPPEVLEWKKGEPYVRQPQNIRRKVGRVLSEVGEGKEINPFQRWRKMDGIGHVGSVLGVLEEADLSDISMDKATYYSARDADATTRIYPILWERIVNLGLEDTFWRDMRAMPMVVDMMANGMPVDLAAFSELSDYFQSRMDSIQGEMQLTVGRHLPGLAINPASYPQMSTLIYDKLMLHEKGGRFKSKKGATQKSTADDILKRYVRLHPVVQSIIDWREYQKLKTSYADAIPKLVVDGRIHTTIRMTRVATGRLSSSNPNLMAQPVRTEEGRKVRDCYVAEEGNVFLSGDFSQVEMRGAASDSKDERMMEIFWAGEDIHAQTASMMFGIPVKDLDEMKHRYPAKRVGFGILNLITAEGLQRELTVGGAEGWTVSDCEDIIKSWFDIYSGIAAYMKSNGEQAKRYGYVRDMWGRIRYIPGIRSTNKWIRLEAERQAGNAPIQMGAQGIIKEAMGKLVPYYRDINKTWGMMKPLIQIHDDIVWEIEEWLVDFVMKGVQTIMEGSAPKGFLVPLEVDFKSGVRWGSMKSPHRY